MFLSPNCEWQLAYNAVQLESDPDKALPLLCCAVMALERRSAEWDQKPGTEEELSAVLESISTLRERLAWYRAFGRSSLENVPECSSQRLLDRQAPAVAVMKSAPELQEQIHRRAYELYEQRGREDGHELDHWLQAESEVAQKKAKAVSASR